MATIWISRCGSGGPGSSCSPAGSVQGNGTIVFQHVLFLQTCAGFSDRLCCAKACHRRCVSEAPPSLGPGALAAFFLARLPPMAVWQFPTFASLFLFAVLPGWCRVLHSLAVCTYLCRSALSKRCCQHSRREHIRPCACTKRRAVCTLLYRHEAPRLCAAHVLWQAVGCLGSL